MLDELRDRMVAYIARNRVCVIASLNTGGQAWVWAVPARYDHNGLELDCLIPRWVDAAYHVQQNPQVLLIVHDEKSQGASWLEYRGIAELLPCKKWTAIGLEGMPASALADRFIVLHVRPERIDMLDESRGWGARETLEV